MAKSKNQASKFEISSAEIMQLAERHKLDIKDFSAFDASIRIDFEVFQRDRTAKNANQQHDEIDRLYKAAIRGNIPAVATALEKLSPESRASLSERGKLIGLPLPSAGELMGAIDPKTICTVVVKLCRVGGEMIKGRKRPSGKKSIEWAVELHAPKMQRGFAKRAAETGFIINLQLTWLEATGQSPAVTANHEVPGPFVRFVKDCLALAGVKYVDVVETLNRVTHDRKDRKEIESKRMLKTP